MSDTKAFEDAVLAAVRTDLGDLVDTVALYEEAVRGSEPIDTPAALLSLESWESGEDAGDGRTPLRLRATLYLYLGARTQRIEREIRAFAARVCRIVYQSRWGLGSAVDVPEELEAGPVELEPDREAYRCWFVHWEQVLRLGDDAWDAAGVAPETIFLGRAPDVGAGHEVDYDQVGP